MGRANPDKLGALVAPVRRQMIALQKKHGCWMPDMNGLCGIASYQIFNLLKDIGMSPRLCMNEYHAFVLCGGMIVDVTATQFCNSFPAVFVSPRKKWERWNIHGYEPFKAEEKLSKLTDINKAFGGWPYDQKPQYAFDQGLLPFHKKK